MFETYIGTKIIKAQPMMLNDAEEVLERKIQSNNAEGYLVKYPDNYLSWSPKKAFVGAYRKLNEMTFGMALEVLKLGKRVARKGWNGKGIFIELQRPDENSKMTSPYIFIDTTGLQTENSHAPKSRVPWLASQTDMLAEDWVVVNE